MAADHEHALTAYGQAPLTTWCCAHAVTLPAPNAPFTSTTSDATVAIE